MLVMELFSNVTIQTYIKRMYPKGYMPENTTKNIFRQIVNGIRCMHDKNIVHRDIKLANILINQKEQIKIIDFGFAK